MSSLSSMATWRSMHQEPDGGTRIIGRFGWNGPRRFLLAIFRGFVYLFGFVMTGFSLYGAFKTDPAARPLAFLVLPLFFGFTWFLLWCVRHAGGEDQTILLEFLTANLNRGLDDPRLPG